MALPGHSISYPNNFDLNFYQIHCIPLKLSTEFARGNTHRLVKVFHTITPSLPLQKLNKERAALVMLKPEPTITIDISNHHHAGGFTKEDVTKYAKLIREKLGERASPEDLKRYGITQERGKTQWVHTSADKLLKLESNIKLGNDMVTIINGIGDREEIQQRGGGGAGGAGGAGEEREGQRGGGRPLARNEQLRDRSRRDVRVRSRSICDNRERPADGYGRDRSGSTGSERRSLSYELSDRDIRARDRSREDRRRRHSSPYRGHNTRYHIRNRNLDYRR